MTTETERTAPKRDVVGQLRHEASHVESANSYGADVLAPLLREAADEIEALASAPSAPPHQGPVPTPKFLRDRAQWYREGCDGLEDVEGYKAEKVDALKRKFIVDEPPVQNGKRRRAFGRPSQRPYPPRYGVQLLTWMTEEADEQMQLGAKSGKVKIARRDLKHLLALLDWLPKRPGGEPVGARPSWEKADDEV
jgi:hypothetical protein